MATCILREITITCVESLLIRHIQYYQEFQVIEQQQQDQQEQH